MRNLLIITKQKEQAKALANLVRPFHFDTIDITDSAQESRRKVQQKYYNLVIIITPLYHELGSELALDILEKDEADIIVIANNKDLAQIEEKLIHEPIFLVEKPIERNKLQRDINYLLNNQKKRERLEKQNKKLKNNINSLKSQFRAKLLLMKNLDMSEDEAHHYLQKQAMNTRKTPGDIAEAIIKLYSN